MLYEKNKNGELSRELFKNPTSEYRGAPFWSWNCKMTKELLTEQIPIFKQMGFGGFFMHSRSGMDNEYLSDEFMQLIRDCTDKADSENLIAWLYDEDRWPSGAAGGLVTKNPKYRMRMLLFGKEKFFPDLPDEADFDAAIEKGLPYFAAAYDVELNKNGELKSYALIDRQEKAKHMKYLAFCVTQKPSDWYNGQTYLDTLEKTAVDKFIETTYKKYFDVLSDKLGKTVHAIFTDEPNLSGNKQLFDKPDDDGAVCLPWTPAFPETFKAEYGFDILERLPEVLWDLPNGELSRARYAYRNRLTDSFTESFAKNIGEACEKHNLKLTGHVLNEPWLYSQSISVGEAMRSYPYFGYPGIDMLCNSVELTTAKQVQSVARQYGKEAIISELYGVTGWHYDFRGHKFQGDWQAALGVTVRVPHLSWVSMKGDAKRDYPASIFYQSPWYKEYPIVENHFARLNTALTRGEPLARVAVIHPVESYWLYLGPNSASNKRDSLDREFGELIQWLLLNQIDFDYISEALLPNEITDNPRQVGLMTYDAVIVPNLTTVRSTTLKFLNDFGAAGGKVVFVGGCPKYVDAIQNDAAKPLYDRSVRISFVQAEILHALEDFRDVEITDKTGERQRNYIYQLRQDGDAKWLFIANAVKLDEPDCADFVDCVITVRGEFTPELYDTMTGEIKPLDYRCENGKTLIFKRMYAHDSVLLKLTPGGSEFTTERKKQTFIKDIVFDNADFTLSEPNVLLLDVAEYALDGESEFAPAEEILRLDAAARKRLNLPPRSSCQPWCIPEVKPEHTITLRFTVNSETAVKHPLLALESREDCAITFDGKPVDNRAVGYFTDRDIETVALPDIERGKHVITVTMPISVRTYTEWCYLLGDFGVKINGTEKTLVPLPDKLPFGSVTDWGLPFYGANITYRTEFTATEDCSAVVSAAKYRGACVKVALDGKSVGSIVFAPYRLKIDNVTKGKHILELTVFGNRANSFGPVHDSVYNRYWLGPDAWYTTGCEWTYTYCLKPFGLLESPVVELEKR